MRYLSACAAVLVLPLAVLAADPKPPADLPDTTESAKLPARMPKTVAGRVTLDGKPLPNARVTDGVDFVTTDAAGRYSITLKDDPMIPYTPARTVAVSWPDGAWPVRDARTKAWKFWARLKDIQDPANVDFELTARKQEGPVVVSFGTDAHDNFSRAHNYTWLDETIEAGSHVTVAVDGGDMGYIGFGNADEAYGAIRRFSDQFPLPLLHLIGNHDVVGIHSTWWSVPHENAGNGAFTKYLNPIRWSFDCGGMHFVGMDWALKEKDGSIQLGIANSALDWFERDLQALPKGTPVFFFNHQTWSPHKRYYDLCAKYNVKLALGGHSHRNMFLDKGPGGTEFWTKMSEYTLVYCTKDGFEFVDRCVYEGARTHWAAHWGHHGRACALYHEFPGLAPDFKGPHESAANVTLDSKSASLAPVPGPTYDLRIGARPCGPKPAALWGLRLTGQDGKTHTFTYSPREGLCDLMGLKTPLRPAIPRRAPLKPSPAPAATTVPAGSETDWVEFRLLVMPDRIRVLVNGRAHYEKFVQAGPASKIEFFSEGGPAEFGRVDVWARPWPDYKPKRVANNP